MDAAPPFSVGFDIKDGDRAMMEEGEETPEAKMASPPGVMQPEYARYDCTTDAPRRYSGPSVSVTPAPSEREPADRRPSKNG